MTDAVRSVARSAAPIVRAGGPLRRTVGRGIVEAVVAVLIAVLLIKTWHLQWFIVPSDSMAETLVGVHRRMVCDDCGHAFACGTEEPPPAGKRAVCPNCDYAEQELADAGDADGDRLLVHKGAFALRMPRRWEPIAFRNPAAAGEAVVKRVVGLPGETIEIRAGDVYADGAIQRKDLSRQRALAILVYDAGEQPSLTAGLPERWRGEPGATRWESTAGAYTFPALTADAASRPAPANRTTDWLTYRHWRRVPGFADRVQEEPIDDRHGYNQTRPVLETYRVRDLLLSFRCRTQGRGRLLLFATDGQSEFVVRWDPSERRAELLRQAVVVAEAAGLPMSDAETCVELSLVDQQVLLALDGQVVLSYPFQPSDLPWRPTSRPLAIGSQGLGVKVRKLRLYRDVYYTPPRPRGPPKTAARQYSLADDEYFVMGDNSPFSSDSRHWARAGVPCELLLGKPFLVYFPSRLLRWGSRQFQVPDLARIRYIH